MSFYEIVEKDATGTDIPFSKFMGKVVYGVNVASKCGYVRMIATVVISVPLTQICTDRLWI
jgi:glutathione peroxidase-family protein